MVFGRNEDWGFDKSKNPFDIRIQLLMGHIALFSQTPNLYINPRALIFIKISSRDVLLISLYPDIMESEHIGGISDSSRNSLRQMV